MIREAVQAVEMMGAHPLLTEAVLLLDHARDKVADWIELPRCKWGVHLPLSPSLVFCSVCHRVQHSYNTNEPCNGPQKISLRADQLEDT